MTEMTDSLVGAAGGLLSLGITAGIASKMMGNSMKSYSSPRSRHRHARASRRRSHDGYW